MALEERNGNSYYYRYERTGDKVRKIYEGSGRTAQIFAKSDEVLRARDETRAEREREDRKRLEATAAPVLELEDVSRVLARAHLVAGGYKRTKGEWRMPKNE